MKYLRFQFWLAIGICISLLWSCAISFVPISVSPVNSFESADRYLREQLLPSINVDSQFVSDTDAYSVSVPPLAEPVPNPDRFPLYGAQATNDPNILYLEIYSSAEKANGERPDERWLVDVAEKFNQQRQTVSSGQTIQVGIRNIPSGLGAQVIAAQKGRPAGYTPATALWVEILKSKGIPLQSIAPKLVENQAIFAVQPQVYQELAQGGEVTFDRLLDAILAGKVKVGYSNPYIASSALNFLYTLLWHTARPPQNGKLSAKNLTIADLELPETTSTFDIFQQRVTLITPTYLDLKQIWLRDPQAFQAIVMAYQSYVTLKQQPGFEQLQAIPFGIPEASPLVGFAWNTPAEREALQKFAAFATSAPMQTLAAQQGYQQTDYLKRGQFPPVPSGEVLQAAQSLWKQRKDGGKTVYMELVVDTSGSMEQDGRLRAVQDALRFASRQINPGNQIGLVTFSDRPTRRIPLTPFSSLEQKRLFAAIDQLQPGGATALYDGLAIGLADLMEKKKADPDGRFYLLLLTDGERTDGLQFNAIENVIQYSGVRVYPIAYGEVNQQELEAIAAIREGTVYQGTPEKVQLLLKDLFQTSL